MSQSPTPRNDFCRMFVRENILDPLSTSILSIMKDQSLSTDDDSCARAVNILLLFSQVAQADSRVRDAFANRSIMIRQFCTMSRPNGQLEELTALGLLEACSGLPRKLMVVAIKAIKHLATSPQLIETLQNSMAMNVLVELLGKSINRSHGNVSPITTSCRCAAYIVAGDRITHISDNLLDDTIVQVETGRGCFIRHHTALENRHRGQIALKTVRVACAL